MTNEADQTMVDQLRATLTNQQRQVVNDIWDYHRRQKVWIPTKVLHRNISRSTAVDAVTQLGGDIVFTTSPDGRERYQLTALGALLTDRGYEFDQLLSGFLEYTRDKYNADPECDRVESEDVEKILELSDDQSRDLMELLSLFHLRSSSGERNGRPRWTARMPDYVDELPEIIDLRARVHEEACRGYRPGAPYSEVDRANGFLLGQQNHWGQALKDQNGSPQSMPSELSANNLFSFITDAALKRRLISDWEEARQVQHVRAWKSCIVLCGGILEGILIDALLTAEIKSEGEPSSEKYAKQTLATLVVTASRCGVISKATEKLIDAIREYRNLVHPGRQLSESIEVSEHIANVAISAVLACQQDIVSRCAQTGA